MNFASNAAGTRKLQLRKNSAESVGSGLGLGGTWTYDAVSTSVTTVWGEVVVPLERGDHVNLFAYQDCGDRLTVNAGKDVTLPAGRPDERLRLPRSAFGELLDDAGLDVPCCVF